MQHFNQLWITCIFLFVVQCNAEQSVRDPNNSGSAAAKGLSSFEFVKTFPMYHMTDSDVYSSLKGLAQTKPTFPPDIGLGNLGSIWANLYVDSVAHSGMDGEQYVVSIFNELHPAPDGSLSYRLGLMSLSHVVIKRPKSVTHRIGYYNSPKSIDMVVSLVCKMAGIGKPTTISPQEQSAPNTIAIYGTAEESAFTKVDELAKSAAFPVVNDTPVATFEIAPVQRFIQSESTYQVELFMTPGLIRISSERSNAPGMKELETIGYVTDTNVWNLLCGIAKAGPQKTNK